MRYLKSPKFGLHIFNALFLIGFGAALIWARLPAGSSTYLPKLGLSAGIAGYLMVVSGVLMILSKSTKWQIIFCFSLMPYTIAAFLLFFETGAAQSIMVFSFIQVAMPILIQCNDLLFGGGT